MAKIQKRKFFEIDVPLVNEKVESSSSSVEGLVNKTIKLDITRKLKGKSVDLIFKINLEDKQAVARPKKIVLLPFFIGHMMHKGVSYVEDSFEAETKDSKVVIKPFLITRKKVSRAVRRTLRNSAKNWIGDYLKEKEDDEVFHELLTNQFQRALSLRLKKIYPLSVCEIRVFEIKKQLEKKEEKQIGEIEIKKEVSEKNGEIKEESEEITEKIEIEEKPKKKKKETKKETE